MQKKGHFQVRLGRVEHGKSSWLPSPSMPTSEEGFSAGLWGDLHSTRPGQAPWMSQILKTSSRRQSTHGLVSGKDRGPGTTWKSLHRPQRSTWGDLLPLMPPSGVSSGSQGPRFSSRQQVYRQRIKSPNLSFSFFKDVTSLRLPWQHPPASLKSGLSSLQQPPSSCPPSSPAAQLSPRPQGSRFSRPSSSDAVGSGDGWGWGGGLQRSPENRQVSDSNELPRGTGLSGTAGHDEAAEGPCLLHRQLPVPAAATVLWNSPFLHQSPEGTRRAEKKESVEPARTSPAARAAGGPASQGLGRWAWAKPCAKAAIGWGSGPRPSPSFPGPASSLLPAPPSWTAHLQWQSRATVRAPTLGLALPPWSPPGF